MIKLYKCEVFCADALSSGVISAGATCASEIHGSRWPFCVGIAARGGRREGECRSR